jgi:hypothetical protein
VACDLAASSSAFSNSLSIAGSPINNMRVKLGCPEGHPFSYIAAAVLIMPIRSGRSSKNP